VSIFASLDAPDGDGHTDGCASWDKHGGIWELSSRPCDCGQPDAPIVYRGSHVLPAETDGRGGWVDIALIPGHVRYWRENPCAPAETEPVDAPPDPFLRFGVNNETVILTRRNVEQIAASPTYWLEALEPPGQPTGGVGAPDPQEAS